MQSHASDLVVRRHDRIACRLPAAVTIEEADNAAVRLARGALGTNGQLHVTVVDVSRGGLGLSSPVYLPPSCRLRLEMRMPNGESLSAPVRVHRAAMSDRKPTYYIGTAFEGATPERAEQIESILRTLSAAEGGHA